MLGAYKLIFLIMENIEKDHKLLFDIYDINKDDSITLESFELILESLGLSAEFQSLLSEDYISRFSYDDFSQILKRLSEKVDLKNNQFLFEDYADESGYITESKLRELIVNHIDNITDSEIDNLIEDFMNGEDKINYDRFKKIKIF